MRRDTAISKMRIQGGETEAQGREAEGGQAEAQGHQNQAEVRFVISGLTPSDSRADSRARPPWGRPENGNGIQEGEVVVVKGLIDALENTEVDTVLSSDDFKSQSNCGNCFIQLIEKTDEEGYRKTFLVGVCKVCGEVCFVSDPPGKEEKLEQYEIEIKEDPGHLTRLAEKHCKCRKKCNHAKLDPEVEDIKNRVKLMNQSKK